METIKALLSQGELGSALQQLSQQKTQLGEEWQDTLILLQARWSHIEKQRIGGMLNEHEVSQEKNKLTEAVLSLLPHIETTPQGGKTALAEMEQQFLNGAVKQEIQALKQNQATYAHAQIKIEQSQDVVIGSGNTLVKKTFNALGTRQFWGIAAGILVLVVGGYWGVSRLLLGQGQIYASLSDVKSEYEDLLNENSLLKANLAGKDAEILTAIQEGMELLDNENYPDAITKFKSVEAEVPLASIDQNIAYAYEQLGDTEQAAIYREKAQQILAERAEWKQLPLLNVGDKIADTLGYGGSRKYKIKLSPNRRVFMEEKTNNPDLRWELRDELGKQIVGQSMIRDLGRIHVAFDGTYLLSIKTQYEKARGPFSFVIHPVPEPETTNIQVGQEVEGAIDAYGAWHYYTMDLPAKTWIFVGVSNLAEDLKWEFRDSRDKRLDGGTLRNNIGKLYSEFAGNYTLSIHGEYNKGFGAYAFKVHPVPLPMEDTLQLNETIEGKIDSFGEVHNYHLELAPDEVYAFRSLDNKDQYRLDWVLLDPQGNQITKLRLGSGMERIRSTLGGRHTLRILGNYDKGLGKYRIQFIKAP